MKRQQTSHRRTPTVVARARATLAPFASVGVTRVILRLFLGGTMLYAGIDKLILDPRFLQAEGAGSIGETLRFFVTAGGPLAPLVEAVGLSQPVAVGAAIVISQLAVAGSLLASVRIRIGALLGAAISLTLALTSTWGVSPYYLANDLPYLVGFLALAALGDGGPARISASARLGYDPTRRAALVSGAGILGMLVALILLDRARLGSLLSGSGAASGSATTSASPVVSPSVSPSPSSAPSASASPSPDSSGKSPKPSESATSGKSPKPSESATSGGGSGAGGGTAIDGGKNLGPGQALNFSAGGTAAVLLNDGGTYRAFERACTHAGTNVDWQSESGSFYCNNHGARFSASGEVLVGPANRPLRPIEVSVAADGSVTYRR